MWSLALHCSGVGVKPHILTQVGYGGCTSPQPKNTTRPNTWMPPSGAAFAFSTPVEALWKQEGEKSFVIKRIAGATEIISIQTTTCTCAAFIAAIAAWISA